MHLTCAGDWCAKSEIARSTTMLAVLRTEYMPRPSCRSHMERVLAIRTKCSNPPFCRSFRFVSASDARTSYHSHIVRQSTLVRSLLLALLYIPTMLPSIICVALLSFASPTLSRPVVPSTAGKDAARRTLNKRAPQGPKIGNANFPGKAGRETSVLTSG